MSTATIARRRPRLKVISAQSPSATRHVITWEETESAIEVWTYQEWDAMHPAERPDAGELPGIGYIRHWFPTPEESQYLTDLRDDQVAHGRLLRGEDW